MAGGHTKHCEVKNLSVFEKLNVLSEFECLHKKKLLIKFSVYFLLHH